MEPQMNKQVQHVFLFLCQKPLWAQISWKPTGPRRHKFGEMHSGSRPLTDPGECPRLGSRLQLFSEQNTASASQNKADKSYTDSETDNYQRFVFCREQKEIFEERERRARALKKKTDSQRNLMKTRCERRKEERRESTVFSFNIHPTLHKISLHDWTTGSYEMFSGYPVCSCC